MIWRLLTDRLARDPDACLAVDEHGGSLTVGEATDRALLTAGALVDRYGIGRGDVVSWQLPNWLDTVVLCLALCRLQVVQNPIVPILGEREVGFITDQAGTRLLIRADRAGREPVSPGCSVLTIDRGGLPGLDRALPPRVEEPEAAVRWLFYTSGTTADPKGCRHRDAGLVAASRGMVEALGIGAGDRIATLLPLTHVGGVVRIVTSLLTGSRMLLSGVFDPSVTIPFLRSGGVTMVPGAPPFLHAAFAHQDGHPDAGPLFPRARLFLHGGSPTPPNLHAEVRRRFGTVGIVSGYGMTECPMAVWNRHDDDDAALAGTEGRPVPGVEVRITDGSGAAVAAGTEGEVWLRGPQLMSGYVDATLDLGAFDAGGHLRTGDLGVLDAGGNLRITGRLKDVIIRNMENISAGELEQLLHLHPQVREVAVVGIPDEVTGERACAVVVPTDPAGPPTLDGLCSHLLGSGLGRRKLPERLVVTDRLPRNAMEKVDKEVLRRRLIPD